MEEKYRTTLLGAWHILIAAAVFELLFMSSASLVHTVLVAFLAAVSMVLWVVILWYVWTRDEP